MREVTDINTYRDYYRTSKDEHPTNFIKRSKCDWECTHGDWIGTVKDEDELTLHHYYGSVTYDHYKEYTESETNRYLEEWEEE